MPLCVYPVTVSTPSSIPLSFLFLFLQLEMFCERSISRPLSWHTTASEIPELHKNQITTVVSYFPIRLTLLSLIQLYWLDEILQKDGGCLVAGRLVSSMRRRPVARQLVWQPIPILGSPVNSKHMHRCEKPPDGFTVPTGRISWPGLAAKLSSC